MEKDAIFNQRAQMKKKAHTVVKSHYLILVFLVLLLTLFGTEFQWTTIGMGKIDPRAGARQGEESDPGTLLDEGNGPFLAASDVFNAITAGRIAQGVLGAARLEQNFLEEEKGNPALGRRRGVLAVDRKSVV